MGGCYFPDCSHRSDRKRCKFFRLPKSPGSRKKWLSACNLSESTNLKNVKFCGCHFQQKDRKSTPNRNLITTPPQWKRGSFAIQPRNILGDRTNGNIPIGVAEVGNCSPVILTDRNRSDVREAENHSFSQNGNDASPVMKYDSASVASWRSFISSHFSNSSMYLSPPRDFSSCDSSGIGSTTFFACSPQNNTPCEVAEINDSGSDINIRDELEHLRAENAILSEKCKRVDDLEVELENLRPENRACKETLKRKDSSEKQVHDLTDEILALKDKCDRVDDLETELEYVRLEYKTLAKKCEKFEAELKNKDGDLKLMCKVSSALKIEKEKYRIDCENAAKNDKFFERVFTEEKISHYTGLPNLGTFFWLLSTIPEDLKYYLGFPVRKLSRAKQLFLTLMKLKRNASHTMLGDLFHVSKASISNIVITWVSALHTVLVEGMMRDIPSLKKCQQSMPESFREYPNCRIILDCTEVGIEIPGLMSTHNKVFSHYKGKTTFKGLVGVAPNGTAIFISELYPGSTSDKNIVIHTKILDRLEPGDAVMADKGFLIRDILPPGVELNIPTFKDNPQFTGGQVFETLQIAQSRIHVERAIRDIKLLKILDLMPHSLFQFPSQVFQVCGALSNLRRPLIKEVEGAMRQA